MTDLSPAPCPTPRRAAGRSDGGSRCVVLGLVLVAGGVIVTQFLRSAVDYYCNVDEIGVRTGCDGDRRLRVQGTVDDGSIVDGERCHGVHDHVQRRHPAGRATTVSRAGSSRSACRWSCTALEDGTFMGDDIEVKHDSEYEAENADRIAEAEAEAACDLPVGTADDRGEPQRRARQRRADADAGVDACRRAVDGVLDRAGNTRTLRQAPRYAWLGARGRGAGGRDDAAGADHPRLLARLRPAGRLGRHAAALQRRRDVGALEGSILLWALILGRLHGGGRLAVPASAPTTRSSAGRSS